MVISRPTIRPRVAGARRALVTNVRRATQAARGEERERAYRSLSPPLVRLLVSPDYRAESRQAFHILASAHTGFRVERAPDHRVAAEFAGKTQYGIEGVTRLHNALLRFEQTLLKPGPDIDPIIARMQYPGIKEQTERELDEQLSAAKADLDRILA